MPSNSKNNKDSKLSGKQEPKKAKKQPQAWLLDWTEDDWKLSYTEEEKASFGGDYHKYKDWLRDYLPENPAYGPPLTVEHGNVSFAPRVEGSRADLRGMHTNRERFLHNPPSSPHRLLGRSSRPPV